MHHAFIVFYWANRSVVVVITLTLLRTYRHRAFSAVAQKPPPHPLQFDFPDPHGYMKYISRARFFTATCSVRMTRMSFDNCLTGYVLSHQYCKCD